MWHSEAYLKLKQSGSGSGGRAVIIRALQQSLLERPSNLQILEDFSGDLDPDGIHFSIMSGILFVQDLHDQVSQLLLLPAPDPRIRYYSFIFETRY